MMMNVVHRTFDRSHRSADGDGGRLDDFCRDVDHFDRGSYLADRRPGLAPPSSNDDAWASSSKSGIRNQSSNQATLGGLLGGRTRKDVSPVVELASAPRGVVRRPCARSSKATAGAAMDSRWGDEPALAEAAGGLAVAGSGCRERWQTIPRKRQARRNASLLAGCGHRPRRERRGAVLPERVERAPQVVVERRPPTSPLSAWVRYRRLGESRHPIRRTLGVADRGCKPEPQKIPST